MRSWDGCCPPEKVEGPSPDFRELRIFRIRSTLTISLSLVNVKILSFVFCSLSYYLIEEISISLDLRVEPIYLGTVLVT